MQRFLTAILLGALTAAAPAVARAQYVSPQSQAIVADWYSRFLQRPTDAGALGWAQALDQGQNPNKILSGILGSDEYYLRSGSTVQGFVQTLFIELTGRAPAPAEYAFWATSLAQVGGAAPDFEERQDLAYAMLLRYPQGWQTLAPIVVAPTVVAPVVVVPRVYDLDHRLHDHDAYEYHRPVYAPVRRDPVHRDEHDRHDDHDHKRK